MSRDPNAPPPVVSVIIPSRNRRRLLQRALRSALAQEHVDLEVIVVDDASEDETSKVLERVDDARVSSIRLPTRGGPARARNAGLAAARGEWVAFLDDDDVWAPAKLRRQLETAHATGAGFVYVNAVRVDADLRVLGLDGRLPAPSRVATELLSTNPMPAGCSGPIVKTDVARGLGAFDETLFTMADWDLWIRITQSVPSAACQEPLVAYLVHEQSMMFDGAVDIQAEFQTMQRKHGALARQHGQRLNELEFHRWIALVHWRAGYRSRAARILLGAVARHSRPANVALVRDQIGRRLRQWSAAPPAPDAPWLEPYRTQPVDA